MAKILIVDDEADLRSSVRDWLAMDGHRIEEATDGSEALELMQASEFDVVVLDLMLPKINGFEVCRTYRRAGGSARILMLTAKDSISDKQDGFECGADDYLVKPINLQELSIRVRALMRRSIVVAGAQLVVGDLVLDTATHRLFKGGEEVKLVAQELALLEFFMREPNRVFSAETLIRQVWRGQSSPSTVRTHIKTLRQKIERDGTSPQIETIQKLGYCLRV
ncbi:MAG: response regulator transcription factor [Candidatus Obscuribacterales bacterium]|nr:response regulator transcription factor [Candidatus Obscuribacterales bacterium]